MTKTTSISALICLLGFFSRAHAQTPTPLTTEGMDIIYINVMNNMSVDCDCDGHPAAPHTVECAEQLGLGTRKYTIVSIDNK